MEQFPDPQNGRLYVQKHYGRQLTIGAETAQQHASKAAGLVKRVALDCYKHASGTMLRVDTNRFVTTSAEEQFANLIAAAWLHEAIERSHANYEELAAVANTRVAELVAGVTRDMRLSAELRAISYRAAISAADEETQILVLTDIICTGQALQNWFKAINSGIVDQAVMRQVVELEEDLATMSQIQHHPVLRRYQNSLAVGMRQLFDAADERYNARERQAKLQILQTRLAHEEPKRGTRPTRTAKPAGRRVSKKPGRTGSSGRSPGRRR